MGPLELQRDGASDFAKEAEADDFELEEMSVGVKEADLGLLVIEVVVGGGGVCFGIEAIKGVVDVGDARGACGHPNEPIAWIVSIGG